jgi:hypothetical protein
MGHHMIYYNCKEVKKVGKQKKNKKSESKFKTWLVDTLTDLIIGLILLLIDKLIN